jgi:hypothetical protein
MSKDFTIFSNTFKNAMKDGPSILVLETDDGNEAFCYRRKGEEIDDPECEDVYQAQASGVYFRAVRMRGEEKDHVWLFACDGDEYSIDSFLEHRYLNRSELELAGMAVQTTFQIAKHKDPSLGRRPTAMF